MFYHPFSQKKLIFTTIFHNFQKDVYGKGTKNTSLMPVLQIVLHMVTIPVLAVS